MPLSKGNAPKKRRKKTKGPEQPAVQTSQTKKKKPPQVHKVDPIRDKRVVRETLEALSQDRSPVGERRYLLFATGIYLGRRVSDMLKLKVGDVLNQRELTIAETKTRKRMPLAINTRLQAIYRERLTGRGLEEPLFISSRKTRIAKEVKAIDRRTALRDMKAIAKVARLPATVRIGTHSLRKTFGYWFYQRYRDPETLRQLFNHDDLETTKIYIGLTDDELRGALKKTKDLYED